MAEVLNDAQAPVSTPTAPHVLPWHKEDFPALGSLSKLERPHSQADSRANGEGHVRRTRPSTQVPDIWWEAWEADKLTQAFQIHPATIDEATTKHLSIWPVLSRERCHEHHEVLLAHLADKSLIIPAPLAVEYPEASLSTFSNPSSLHYKSM